MNAAHHCLFTIGHSTHPIKEFLELLSEHGVTALADVRSSPYSSYNPQFNREELASVLQEHSIKYVYLGKELGARSENPSCYEGGRVQYSRLAQQLTFREAISRLIKGAKQYSIALMCAEGEPLECHRTLLVARALEEAEIKVRHILTDGSLETYHDSLERLLKQLGLSSGDLFRSFEDLLAEALERQEEKIAYRTSYPSDAESRESR